MIYQVWRLIPGPRERQAVWTKIYTTLCQEQRSTPQRKGQESKEGSALPRESGNKQGVYRCAQKKEKKREKGPAGTEKRPEILQRHRAKNRANCKQEFEHRRFLSRQAKEWILSFEQWGTSQVSMIKFTLATMWKIGWSRARAVTVTAEGRADRILLVPCAKLLRDQQQRQNCLP